MNAVLYCLIVSAAVAQPRSDDSRKAADAELRAAEVISTVSGNRQDALRRLAHTEAAIKLDPTYEAAAYEHVETLGNLCFQHAEDYRDTEMMSRLIDEVVDYRERFGDDVRRSGEIHNNAIVAVRFTRLYKFVENQEVELTPDVLRAMGRLKRLLEIAAAEDIGAFGGGSNDILSVVYRGMRSRGVPLKKRRRWLKSLLADCQRQYDDRGKSPVRFGLSAHVATQNFFLVRAAELLAEDGQARLVKSIVGRLQNRITRPSDLRDGTLVPRMRDVLIVLDDAAAVQKFDEWVERLKNVKELSPFSIQWPEVDVFDDVKQSPSSGSAHDPFGASIEDTMPKVPYAEFHYPHSRQAIGSTRMRPLVIVDDRLYAIIGSRLVVMQLDQLDSTTGNAEKEKIVNAAVWDSIELPPSRNSFNGLTVRDARFDRGKLYLATEFSGLLEFDPTINVWKVYGPDQGLPSWTVLSVFPVEEDLLFCTTVANLDTTTVHFTLNVATGQVAVVRSEQRGDGNWPEPGFIYHWRIGERWLALSEHQLWRDLLRDTCGWQDISARTDYGWSHDRWEIEAVAEVGNQRFFLRPGGLSEFNSDGAIVRSWSPQNQLQPDGPVLTWESLVTPPDCPMPPWPDGLAVYGEHLVIFGGDVFDNALVAFDPETDTWYGPLRGPEGRWVVSGKNGVWLCGGPRLNYIDLNQIINTAAGLGRVMTTAEFRQRRDHIIDGMSSLHQAKIAFAQHKTDRAREQLAAILQREPAQPEALLLMGDLHAYLIAEQDRNAVAFYKRLAMSDDAVTALTGMYSECLLHVRKQRWKEANDLANRILDRFSNLAEYVEDDLKSWRRSSREDLNSDKTDDIE